MKILITGGLGTIGLILVNELKKCGYNIWVCDLKHSFDEKYIRCDVANYRQLSRIFELHKFDYVYHLAAEFGRWSGEEYYDTLWRSNVIGTKNIIRMQEKYGFRQIFFSSSEVYGDYRGVMSEDVMDKFGIKQLNDYAMTKWVGEMQIMNSKEQFETESLRVRLSNTYGKGEFYTPYRNAICKFIYHALKDLPYTVYLGHKRTSTYFTDTVRTLVNIVDNFKTGEVYNIGGGQSHSIKYLSDLILKCLGKTDKKVKYIEGEQFTTKVKRIDITKAEHDLDHKNLITLEEGIPKTIEWMKSIYGK